MDDARKASIGYSSFLTATVYNTQLSGQIRKCDKTRLSAAALSIAGDYDIPAENVFVRRCSGPCQFLSLQIAVDLVSDEYQSRDVFWILGIQNTIWGC